jgi:predicted transcriptional regulator
MPTKNPRVNVTLSPSLDRLVSQLAEGQQSSKAQVLRELLEAAEPALQRVVLLMTAAEKATHEVREGLGRSLDRSTQVLERALADGLRGLDEATGDLVHMAEAVRGRRVKGAAALPGARSKGAKTGENAGLTPVPVTRGSGLPTVTRKGRKNGLV